MEYNQEESLRVQKTQWMKNRIEKQRDAEEHFFDQLIAEQRILDEMNTSIDDNMERSKESQRYQQEFQEDMNARIYELHGISEDKLEGMKEVKNAYYRGCAFSLFLLSVVLVVLCGVLHGFQSEICLFMIAFSGIEGSLLSQDGKRGKVVDILCKFLYLLMFPTMMIEFVCFELGYPEYSLFMPYMIGAALVILMIGTSTFFLYDPYRKEKKKVSDAKDTIRNIEKVAKKEVRKNQKTREKEEQRILKLQNQEEIKIQKMKDKEEAKQQKAIDEVAKKQQRELNRDEMKQNLTEKKNELFAKFRKDTVQDNEVENQVDNEAENQVDNEAENEAENEVKTEEQVAQEPETEQLENVE